MSSSEESEPSDPQYSEQSDHSDFSRQRDEQNKRLKIVGDENDPLYQLANQHNSNFKAFSTTFNFKNQMKKLVTTIQDKNPNLFVTRALKKQLYYQQKSNCLS